MSEKKHSETQDGLDEILQRIMPWANDTRAILDDYEVAEPELAPNISRMRVLTDKIEEIAKSLLEDLAVYRKEGCQ